MIHYLVTVKHCYTLYNMSEKELLFYFIYLFIHLFFAYPTLVITNKARKMEEVRYSSDYKRANSVVEIYILFLWFPSAVSW